MTRGSLDCLDERRRHEVRRQDWNGLDYLEVSDDQRTLTVYFLGPAPEGLTRENIRITGGQRIRDIQVIDVRICPQQDRELDNCMVVAVDRPGDFSTYELCLVELPQDTPFDVRYRCLPFTFKAGCPTDLDCATAPVCPPDAHSEPEISYLAKDYASFRRLVLDRLAVVMPDWTERHVPDIGITLVELLAYVGDDLSYYQDAVATEAYLATARQRISVRRHARLVDYVVHEGCNARAWVHVRASVDIELPPTQLSFLTRFDQLPDVEGRLLRWEDLHDVPAHTFEVFEPRLTEPAAHVRFRTAHNEIHVYTWGDAECCLQRGATSATLVDGAASPAEPIEAPVGKYDERGANDQPGKAEERYEQEKPPDGPDGRRVLELEPGDLLLFEEVIGPMTAAPEDADPSRRHVVRLTRVEPIVDALHDQPLLAVEWAEEDALPFPLCLSVVGPPPVCAGVEHVSVARGNVLLVDHGRRRDAPEDLGCVPVAVHEPMCEREGRPADVVRLPGRFRPTLGVGPLTFSEALPPGAAPAKRLIAQEPRAAVPWIRLVSRLDPDCDADPASATTPRDWMPRPDLLGSGAGDDHYVVEMDDRRRAHLRFGDGETGRRPDAGSRFEALYRTGNGPAGNVGADTIVIAVTHDLFSGVALQPHNPLPARGGTAPEPIAEVKRFAPHAFRQRIERAITAADYARLAERHPGVQRAAAELRWNGSWFEVRVAIDPLGRIPADDALLREIERHLYPYRRIGHDLAVRPARYVPLDIVLDVCVEPGFLRGHVRAALLERFGTRRLPDGSLGFFHPDRLSFGEGIALSRLVAAAQAVTGVASVSVKKLERLFEGASGEIEAGVLSIGPLEIARLDSDPSFPENGRIRFDLRGGR